MSYCDFTIYDMIARNAGLYPDKEAIVYGDARISFRAYQKICDQYAAGISGEGVAVGDRIAVLAGNSDDFLILCGAAAKIGAILVLVNWRLGEEEIEYILKDTTPKLLVSDGEYGDLARRAASKVDSVEKRFSFTTGGGEGDGVPFRSLRREDGCEEASIAAVPADSAFVIIHTAAVGGRPKGCLLSQGNMIACGLQIDHLLHLDNRDCHLGILPLFHIGGQAMTWATMLQGGKNVIVNRFDPHHVLKLITNEQGTFFVAFPPILAAILDVQEKEPCNAASLRIVCGMDSPETLARFFKINARAAFYSLYGQTEAMPVSGCNYQERPGSIGPPALLTRVALLDDLDGETPPGATGEICVRSPAVFHGYWHLEEETSYALRNGWHHTGDLGRYDEDGFLWYAGRKPEKELIKPGGENVYPAEVEKVILSHGAIEEVSVIGVPDPEWGEAVKAVCVLKEGSAVSAGELIEYVASKIARYKKPRHVVFVESLPKTATGAVNREEVKKAYTETS